MKKGDIEQNVKDIFNRFLEASLYNVEESMAWCPFKRLIVQVQWNLEPKYYSDPENPKGNTQRIHLIAIKGDIDS